MDDTEYERAVTPLIGEIREHLLLALIEIRRSGPGPHADCETAELERLRRTLAAVELKLETIESARLAGRDEGFRSGLAVARRAREGAIAQAAGNVIALRAPRANSA